MLYLLALAHAVMDASSAWLLFRPQAWSHLALAFLLYNFLGFALQPFWGLCVDRWKSESVTLKLSLALMLLALCLQDPLQARYLSWVSILLAGVASALFHVSAGALVLQQQKQRLQNSGIFTAPGVLGLSLGTVAAWQYVPIQTILSGALVLLLLVQFCYRPQAVQSRSEAALAYNETGFSLELQDLYLLALMGAVVIKSMLWGQVQLFEKAPWAVLALGLGAFSGKLLGGFLAARLSLRPVAIGGIFVACLAVMFPVSAFSLFCLALGLQSVTPLALACTAMLLPQRLGLATGLSLGFALALGGIPMMMGVYVLWPVWLLGLGLVVLAGVLYWSLAYFEVVPARGPDPQKKKHVA